MNNNLGKSVSVSSTKSKKPQRKSRQDGYRKKFGNRPHIIIPEADSEFIETQTATVMRLFHQCWRADPYGSHWMQLNHTLTYKSFMRAKKILSEKGLFMFKPQKSTIKSKETVCWKVFNLHGARRINFWLNSEGQERSSEGQERSSEGQERSSEGQERSSEGQECPSENSTAQPQQEILNPSETSQERLSNSSEELLETLVVDPEGDDRDRNTALEGRVTSASSKEKKRGEKPKKPENKQQSKTDSSLSCKSCVKDSSWGVVQKSSDDILNQEYIHNPQSQEAVIRSVAQNLAIEAEITSEEYQKSWSEIKARARAIFEQTMKKKKDDRDRRLRGDR